MIHTGNRRAEGRGDSTNVTQVGEIDVNHQPDPVEPHAQCLQWDLGKITDLEVSFGGVPGPLGVMIFLLHLGLGYCPPAS